MYRGGQGGLAFLKGLAVVERFGRIYGSKTCVSLNSRLESNAGEEEKDWNSNSEPGPARDLAVALFG